ncbi:25156_t:CDS:2, partial [Dentiscutata erythropus]
WFVLLIRTPLGFAIDVAIVGGGFHHLLVWDFVVSAALGISSWGCFVVGVAVTGSEALQVVEFVISACG